MEVTPEPKYVFIRGVTGHSMKYVLHLSAPRSLREWGTSLPDPPQCTLVLPWPSFLGGVVTRMCPSPWRSVRSLCGFHGGYFKPSFHRSGHSWVKATGYRALKPLTAGITLSPFTPKSDQCQISPCSLTRNITPHSMKNLTFHSLLRWKVVILQILATSLIQSLFERLGEYTFIAQEWKGEPFHSQEWSMQSHFSKPTHMEDDYINNSLTTSPIQFSLRLGECTFWTWEWKGLMCCRYYRLIRRS